MRLANMTLRSPVDGVLQALSVTTIGQYVTNGEELMNIVPDNMPLEVSAYVLNGDIGFVRKNQEVVVKVDSFPFMRYGVLRGFVKTVATDAMPGAEALQSQHNPSMLTSDGFSATTAAERTQDLVFPATIALKDRFVNFAGQMVELSPGMTVTVDIETERRRLIDYILSPLIYLGANALRER